MTSVAVRTPMPTPSALNMSTTGFKSCNRTILERLKVLLSKIGHLSSGSSKKMSIDWVFPGIEIWTQCGVRKTATSFANSSHQIKYLNAPFESLRAGERHIDRGCAAGHCGYPFAQKRPRTKGFWGTLGMSAVANPATTAPTAHNEALIQRLAQLSAEFGESLVAKVDEVRRIWALIPSAPSAEETLAALVKIHDIVHTLAGAGKSFGFPQVSTAAAPLDGLF